MTKDEGCCIFCLRVFPRSGSGSLKSAKASHEIGFEIQKHFFQLLMRHLLEDEIELMKGAPITELQNSLHLLPCPDCSGILKSFCDYYKEMKVVEMKVKWRLWMLSKVMKCSRKIKCRIRQFQEKMRKLSEEREPLDSCSFIDAVDSFREELITKCTMKVDSGYPKIKLKKIRIPPSTTTAPTIVPTKASRLNSLKKKGRPKSKSKEGRDLGLGNDPVKETGSSEQGHLKDDVLVGIGSGSVNSNNSTLKKIDSLMKIDAVEIEDEDLVESMISLRGMDMEEEMNKNSTTFVKGAIKTSKCDVLEQIMDEKCSVHLPTFDIEKRNPKIEACNDFNDEILTDEQIIFGFDQEEKEQELVTDIQIKTSDDIENEDDAMSNSSAMEAEEGSVLDEYVIQNKGCSGSPSQMSSVSSSHSIQTGLVESGPDLENMALKSETILSPPIIDDILEEPRLIMRPTSPAGKEITSKVANLGIDEPLQIEIKCVKFSPSLDLKKGINNHCVNVNVADNKTQSLKDKETTNDIISVTSNERRTSSRLRYKCSKCSKTFSSPSTLNCHQETCSTALTDELDVNDEDGKETAKYNEKASDNNDDDYIEDACDPPSSEAEESDDSDDDYLKVRVENRQRTATRPPSVAQRRHNHNKVNFMSTRYACKNKGCRDVFYNPLDLKNHSELHGCFKCSFCKKTRRYAPYLSVHELRHKKLEATEKILVKNGEKTNIKFYLCPHCVFKTKMKVEYIRHHLKWHMKLVPNQHTCPICNRTWFGADAKRHRQSFEKHFETQHDLSKLEDKAFVKKCKHTGCPAYFLSSYQLRRHEVQHFKDRKTNVCKHCGQLFVSYIKLVSHRLRHHRRESRIPCKRGCNKVFRSKHKLKQHVKLCRGHVLRKYEQQQLLTLNEFLSKSPLLNDNEPNLDKEPVSEIKSEPGTGQKAEGIAYTFFYVCPEKNCMHIFFTREDIEKHKRLHGTFKCKFCDLTKTYAPDLSIHELQHSEKDLAKKGNVSFPCMQCKLPIYGRGNYIQHHLTEHMNLVPVNLAHCSICKYIFNINITTKMIPSEFSTSIFAHHQRQHGYRKFDLDPSSFYRCDAEDCKAYFVKPVQLDRHKMFAHLKLDEKEDKKNYGKLYNCPDCHKRYKEPYLLRNHRRNRHPDSLKFSCSVEGCWGRFESKAALDRHLKTFQHEKALGPDTDLCNECGKSFKSQVALKLHLRIHDKSLPPRKKVAKSGRFVCTVCKKEVKSKVSLDLHLQSHFGPDSWEFQCDTCGKKCLTRQKLEEHHNTHKKQDKVVFTCEHCGLTYAHRHNFRHHLKSKHNIILENIRTKKKKLMLSD